MNEVFPIGLCLAGRRCLVIGSGAETERRVLNLLAARARVRLVASAPGVTLSRLGSEPSVELLRRPYRESDLSGCWLALLTERNEDAARSIAAAAERRQIFFCAIDQPAHNSFAHLAIANAGPLLVAISTGGRAPAFARRLRQELQRVLDGSEVRSFLDKVHQLRMQLAPNERREALTTLMRQVRLDASLELPQVQSDVKE